MFGWFKGEKERDITPLTTDIHSHLLPGLDDGVKSLAEAEEIILKLLSLGYKKIITTPHVIHDSFRNTNEGIRQKLEELKDHLRLKEISVTIEAAAEYYLDEHLMERLHADEPMLTFGNRYLLFETNFLSEPLNLKEFVFLTIAKGYKPVLAHPERYMYLMNNFNKVQDLTDRGVLLQVNISSLSDYYSRSVRTMAEKLVAKGLVHFLGSDCHNMNQIKALEKARRSRYFRKALTLPLLNNSL